MTAWLHVTTGPPRTDLFCQRPLPLLALSRPLRLRNGTKEMSNARDVLRGGSLDGSQDGGFPVVVGEHEGGGNMQEKDAFRKPECAITMGPFGKAS